MVKFVEPTNHSQNRTLGSKHFQKKTSPLDVAIVRSKAMEWMVKIEIVLRLLTVQFIALDQTAGNILDFF